MPELPEVETVVRSLRPLVVGRHITGAEFRESPSSAPKPKALRMLITSPREFCNRVQGSLIEGIERYGKNVVFQLRRNSGRNGRLYLLVHLGMTGRLTCERTPEFRNKHTHLVLSLDAPDQWIHFSDIRRFGRLRVTERFREDLSKLGPDPLEISADELFTLLHSRRAMLKSLLLDQRFLRGLGNIYADESLFRAGIHPAAIAARLGRKRALRLYDAIRETLAQAIAEGGSSISDYVDAQGQRGFFQLRHQVYRRTGAPCFRCGTRIRKMIMASRSTHFCPKCQRKAGS